MGTRIQLTGRRGQPGVDGQPGAQILSGTGAPTPGAGRDGDYWLDQAAAVLYGPRAFNVWPSTGISLKGPKGDQGVSANTTVTTHTASATYTPALTDHTILVRYADPTYVGAVALPTAVGNRGLEYLILNGNTASLVNVTARSGQTVAGSSGFALDAGRILGVTSDGTNWLLTQPATAEQLGGIGKSLNGFATTPFGPGQSWYQSLLVTSEFATQWATYVGGVLDNNYAYPSGVTGLTSDRTGSRTVLLNSDGATLKFSAPLGRTADWTPGLPDQFSVATQLYPAELTVVVVRPTANGHQLLVENVLGWTQPDSAALTATVYTLQWLSNLAPYWLVTNRVVVPLSSIYTSIEDPATYGPVVIATKIGGAAISDWATLWPKTARYMTALPQVRKTLSGRVANLPGGRYVVMYAEGSDARSFPQFKDTSAGPEVIRAHNAPAIKTVVIPDLQRTTLASGDVIDWVFLHEISHTFDLSYLEGSPSPGAAKDGTAAYRLSDAAALYDLHAPVRVDTTVSEYFRHGTTRLPSDPLYPADIITSPTETDFARGRREWFAESMAAWMLYRHPNGDTTIANSKGTAANGTLARFTAFRTFMDSLGLDAP